MASQGARYFPGFFPEEILGSHRQFGNAEQVKLPQRPSQDRSLFRTWTDPVPITSLCQSTKEQISSAKRERCPGDITSLSRKGRPWLAHLVKSYDLETQPRDNTTSRKDAKENPAAQQ